MIVIKCLKIKTYVLQCKYLNVITYVGSESNRHQSTNNNTIPEYTTFIHSLIESEMGHGKFGYINQMIMLLDITLIGFHSSVQLVLHFLFVFHSIFFVSFFL